MFNCKLVFRLTLNTLQLIRRLTALVERATKCLETAEAYKIFNSTLVKHEQLYEVQRNFTLTKTKHQSITRSTKKNLP